MNSANQTPTGASQKQGLDTETDILSGIQPIPAINAGLGTPLASCLCFSFALHTGFFVAFPSFDFGQDPSLLNLLLEALQSSLDALSLSDSNL